MIFSIISILLVLGGIISAIIFFVNDMRKYTLISAIAIVLGIAFSTFTIVPSGYSGVVVTLGKVQETTMESGLNFKVPLIQKVVKINNQIQREDVEGQAASKDLQTVSFNVSVNYNVIGSQSAELYKTVGKDWATTIIRPAVQEAVKDTFAQFTAEELVTNRSDVSTSIMEGLSETLETYGINVAELNILNMSFSAEYDAAIEAKQTATQEVLTEQQNLEKAKVVAEQKIVEAEAEAEANRIKSESITNEILMSDFLSKWNGELPLVAGSDGVMLDISSMIGE